MNDNELLIIDNKLITAEEAIIYYDNLYYMIAIKKLNDMMKKIEKTSKVISLGYMVLR
jgi:hypothetical protein